MHITVSQQIRHTDPHANAEHDHFNQCAAVRCRVPWPVRLLQKNLHSLLAKLYLYSMMPGTCGSLPPSSVNPIIAHIWSKSLVVDRTDVLVITLENVIHMLLKPDTSNIGNVAPTASTSAPATQVVKTTNSCCTHNTNPSCTSSYSANSMQSSACSMLITWWTQMQSTGSPPNQTSTAPAVLHRSTQSRKPPSRLLEEI